jgi:arylsulfatase A-like enzyme
VGLNLALIPGNPAGLDPRYPTLPEHLAAEGYRNYLVGKWHLGGSMPKHHPLRRGFDEFYGLLGGGWNHYTKQCGAGRYDLWRGYEPEWENTTHGTELINREAVRVVSQHLADNKDGDKPFFLFLSHPAPHDPLMAPERHQRLCGHIPNRRRRLSCAMVAGIDEGVGQLMDLLKQQGELENTVIAYSVDNGGVPYAGALNYPLRGAKTTVYEGGVHVPGFIYAPKHLGKNQDFPGLFHVTDFFPTFASLINSTSRIAKRQELDGVDQLRSLKAASSGAASKSKVPDARTSVHIHRDLDRDSHAYRRGPWKLIVGHHFVPFFFNKVYGEMKSGWLVEGGGWRDKTLELLLTSMDWLMGSENTLFIQYICWVVFDSVNVGGMHRAGNIGVNDQTGLWLSPYPSDLAYWRSQHTQEYPTVSLFNLDEDPQVRLYATSWPIY